MRTRYKPVNVVQEFSDKPMDTKSLHFFNQMGRLNLLAIIIKPKSIEMEKITQKWFPRKQPLTNRASSSMMASQQPKINAGIDCKLVELSLSKIQEEFSINRWRNQSEHPIFRVLHFSYEVQGANNIAIGKIIFEAPEQYFYNLANSMGAKNFFYCFKSVLMACEKLINKFGYFRLTSKMIGITQEKICKMWINEDISLNFPSFKVENEQICVSSILEVFEGAATQTELGHKLFQQIRQERKTVMRLVQALWKFTYENNLAIPPFYEKEQADPVFRRNKRQCKTNPYMTVFCESDRQQFNLRSQDGVSFSNSKNQDSNNSRFFSPVRPLSGAKTNRFDAFPSRQSSQQKENAKSQFLEPNKPSVKSRYSTGQENSCSKKKVVVGLSSNASSDQNSSDSRSVIKNMIKQKIRLSKQNKKVIKLQSVATVKSIGEFTSSELRILGESKNSQENRSELRLELLNAIGRKIQKSQFYIDIALNSSDVSISTGNSENIE